MTSLSLVLLGTGTLAHSICEALATIGSESVDVHVAGRARQKTEQLCYLSGTKAALANRPVRFHPALIGGHTLEDHLGDLLGDLKPAGIVVCASRQSPWEHTVAPSAWTDLVQRAGFGLTLPLHADIAVRAGRVTMAASPGTWLVNACFPDAVNPVLAALGIPVLCGVGNVATLAASVQAALGLPDQGELQLIAHHAHLHPPHGPDDEAQAWLAGARIPQLTALLAAQRASDREALNRVTGHTAAMLLHALVTGADFDTHAPGPGGLAGGFPVRVHDGAVSLRLPTGVTEAQAIAINARAARHDGLREVGTRIQFEPAVTAAAGQLAHGFDINELTSVGHRLLELRDELRAQPHPQGDR
jgi:hypothetical protein